MQIELSYSAYIGKRFFGKEEFPEIDQPLYDQTKSALEDIFRRWLASIDA